MSLFYTWMSTGCFRKARYKSFLFSRKKRQQIKRNEIKVNGLVLNWRRVHNQASIAIALLPINYWFETRTHTHQHTHTHTHTRTYVKRCILCFLHFSSQVYWLKISRKEDVHKMFNFKRERKKQKYFKTCNLVLLFLSHLLHNFHDLLFGAWGKNGVQCMSKLLPLHVY